MNRLIPVNTVVRKLGKGFSQTRHWQVLTRLYEFTQVLTRLCELQAECNTGCNREIASKGCAGKGRLRADSCRLCKQHWQAMMQRLGVFYDEAPRPWGGALSVRLW
jgi:hypothetical protein